MKHKEWKVLGSSLLVTIILTSCATATTPESESAVPSSSVVESSVSETTTETSEETSETSFTVETEEKNNPLVDYAIENPDEYGLAAWRILHQKETYRGIQYGFDNPYSAEGLQQLVYEVTGSLDPSVSLADVGYFQYIGFIGNQIDPKEFSEAYSGASYDSVYLEAIRAIMIEEGLRFGIDEIPTSYLYSRFPRFFYDGCIYDADDKCFDSIDIEAIPDIKEMKNICDTDDAMFIEWLLYASCLKYNGIRAYYMYKNPSGGAVILQVRDVATGMNVLVPTEAQVQELQEDINSIPGCENIDIFTPESPEDFYECYGYYPDELVNSVWSGNTPEGFEEYYNSLPEDEQNELYAPILFE